MIIWFYLVFFVSGAASLIYQVVWVRGLADALGSTVVSMTAVFSVFLGGLALGAFVFGRLNPWGRKALIRYAWIEAGIALLAVGSSFILFSQSETIAAWAPGPDQMGANIAYAFLVSVLLVAPPTLLMGGTLPTFLGAMAPLASPRKLALYLYGWNTVGAATGALAAGFVLIYTLGLNGTILAAAGLDLLSSVGALLLLGCVRFSPFGHAVRPDPYHHLHVNNASRERVARAEGRLRSEWPVLAFVSGGLVLSLEILWGRIASFILGDRTQATAALLFIFISALGVAALLAPSLIRRLAVRSVGQLRRLIGSLLIVGAAVQIVVLFPVVASLSLEPGPFLAMLRETLGGRLALTIALMAPPIVILGLVFPLLLWGYDRMETKPGPSVGLLYFVNTIGAVAGAVLATYLLSRWLGTIPGLHAISIFCGLFGILLLLCSAEGTLSMPRVIPSLLISVPIVISIVFVILTPSSLALVRADETLLIEREDEYGVQVLVRTDSDTYRVRNNRLSLVYDLGLSQTTHAQQMAAHLTVLLAADARDVLNIGTGYGITAGTFTLYPAVEKVRTVEILPFLVDLQEWFAPHNFGLTSKPMVELLQGDGRQALLSSDQTWDIISVNVLDPYLPGSSGLYTTDFWREARQRLNPGGVYTQLFWGADVGLLVRGISEVFPEVHYFPAYGGTSFNIVAFKDARGPIQNVLRFDRAGIDARREWVRIEGGQPEAVMPRLLAQSRRAEQQLLRLSRDASGPLHTDDRPVLEYRWSHGMEGVSPFDSPLILY